ncbi:MAG: MFS transporter [Bacteroidota bacterium]
MAKTFSVQEQRFLGGITLTMSLRQLGLLLVMPFLSVYALNLEGGSTALAGLAIGLYGLTQAVFQIPNGLISDRVGRKPVVLITMSIYTAGLALAALSTNIHLLLIARALQGAGAVSAVLFSWIGDEIPEDRRNRAMAYPGMFVGITSVFSFIVGPLLVHFVNVSQVFWICTGLSALSVLYVAFMMRGPKRQSEVNRLSFSEFRMVISTGRFARYLATGFSINYTLTSIFFLIPLILDHTGQTSHMWMVFVPSTLLGIPVMMRASKAADHYGDHRMIVLGVILLLISTVLLSFHPFVIIILSALFFFPGYMILTTLLPAGVTKLADQHLRGTVTATFNTFQFLGSFAGSLVTGIFYGIHPFYAILVLGVLLGLILVFQLSAPTQKRTE